MNLDELNTDIENTWCPGCGNFAILTAIKKAIPKLEEKSSKIVPKRPMLLKDPIIL